MAPGDVENSKGVQSAALLEGVPQYGSVQNGGSQSGSCKTCTGCQSSTSQAGTQVAHGLSPPLVSEVRIVVKDVLAEEQAARDGRSAEQASLVVIMGVVLLGDMARGVLFPTLWPYVRSMGGDRITQGYAVAAFSFGRVLSSPVLGHWSSRVTYRTVLVTTSLVICLGAVIFALATNNYVLIAGQIVMGLGSGTLGVTRAYVADKSSPQQRTYMLAYLTAVQYGGFTCMPVVGGFLSELLGTTENETLLWGWLKVQWDQYTAPAFFMCLASLVSVLALCTVFTNSRPPDKKAKKKKQPKLAEATETNGLLEGAENGLQNGKALNGQSERPPLLQQASTMSAEGEEPLCGKYTMNDLAIFGGFLLNVATKGTIACFETLGVAYAMDHFSLSSASAGYTFSTFGLVGVFALLSMRALCQRYNDVQLVVFGVVAMILSCALLITKPEGPTGLPLFLVCLFCMYSIGYPIGHTAVLGLFSKVVGNQPQGYLLGWFGSAGSLARIFFPVLAGVIDQDEGSRDLFIVLVCVLLTAGAGLIAARNVYYSYIL